MLFKNKQTNESVNVSNLKMKDGRIFFSVRGKGCGRKFFNRNYMLAHDEDAPDGTYLRLRDGWELEKAPKASARGRKPKAPKAKPEPTPVVAEPIAEPMPSATVEPVVATSEPSFDDALELALLLKRMKGGVVDEKSVRAIVKEELTNIPQAARVIEVHTPKGVGKVKGTVAKNFEIYANLVSAGKPLYLYGPAGSGKSYTARQIADALNLPYYETSQAMFAHDLKGYGDAAGKYVETAFYKAFTGGGVFFLDEVDASAPEALVVLNNAIANKRFDFPVVGNVEAHPDFRVVAAGNTKMTGATMAYVARQMQDTSFKNRFFFEVVGYDRDVFMAITGNDKEIVNFGEDLRRAARKTGISQLFSYRQAKDLATLQECCLGNDAHLLRGSVLQEKEADDAQNLYAALENKSNRWAKAMKTAIEEIKNEEVW